MAGLRLTFDLAALARNWTRLARLAAPAECAAVVKADAYGVGISAAVRTLREAGCRTFFVALAEEGRRVRQAASDAVVYVLNGYDRDTAQIYREDDLRPVLNSTWEIDAWLHDSPGARCAIQVDTGLNRLGLSLSEADELALGSTGTRLGPSLLISHLACADTPHHPLNGRQLAVFAAVRDKFPALPASLCNSAGLHLGKPYHFDLVRPGIALYGAPFTAGLPALESVVTARAEILQVRDARAGETVGYGAGQKLVRDTRLAIASAGYADGYQRAASSSDATPGASGWIRGCRAPLAGRVSMDLATFDVTGITGVAVGDWIELFGPNILIDEVAAAAGTIGYELLTNLSRRARRTYIGATEIR